MKILNKIFKLQSKQAGFSLMELIIVIAIIGIMTSVGLVSLMSGRNQKQLETEARKVISVIREAQNNALTGKTPQTGTYPCAFGVELAPDEISNKYSMTYFYKDSISASCSANRLETNVGDYTLQGGVETDGGGVEFSVPFGKVSVAQMITLTKEGATPISFCVCASGKIAEGNCGGC